MAGAVHACVRAGLEWMGGCVGGCEGAEKS